jgi:Tol biopolymer transport system component
MSADGRFVAFGSSASDLVADDSNVCRQGAVVVSGPCADIFVRDRLAGRTERVSVSTEGAQADGASESPAISADGRFVAFASNASNLVAGDRSNCVGSPFIFSCAGVFVRDRLKGTTERVSVSREGSQSITPGTSLYGMTSPSISADGRFVAFVSDAPNLVAGDTNECQPISHPLGPCPDVFVRDRLLGTTERVSMSSEGVQTNGDSGDPAISADGLFVAFTSWASNLVAGDTNSGADVFVRDRVAGTTERVSVSSSGEQADYSHGGIAGLLSAEPSISADGRFVAFTSYAANLVAGDTNADCQITSAHFNCIDVFVRDRTKRTTERVSVTSGGAAANAASAEPAISADAHYVTFDSDASNLVGEHTSLGAYVFVRDRLAGITTPAVPAPVNTTPPAIPTSGYVGDRIACNRGTWSGSPTFTFAWLRDDDVIAGETGGNYLLTPHDSGHRVRCRVTAHAFGESTVDSNPLIAKLPPLRGGRLLPRPWPPRVGQQLTVTMRVSIGGKPLAAAHVACTATLARRRLAASTHTFRGGTARCGWKIPRAAHGKRLTGSIIATSAGGRTTRNFAGTVR